MYLHFWNELKISMTVTDKIKSDIGHIPKNIFLKNHIIVLQKPYLHE